jgi:pantoate--beta-alanine ligase
MEVVETIAAMRQACIQARTPLGLVPTMGALHEGHLSLVRAARRECGAVAVSIFVNPTQFAAGEDLERYPRTFAEDCALLEREGVDFVFAPAAEEIYPAGGAGTFVEVPGVGDRLDGASRPGHFRGVATVVAKLFNIVQPRNAYFGQKDAAQVAVLRAMVRDLNLPVELRVCATVRDADGLALSSRNRYLSGDERVAALALSQALKRVAAMVASGTCESAVLRDAMRDALSGLRVDYAVVVDPDTLLPVEHACGALVAVAAWVGETRLIDNVVIARPA